MRRDLLNAALGYAETGWPVFPCTPGAKAPLGALVPNGLKNATTDRAVITRWWTMAPTANVAIATGAPAVDVVDVDTKGGRAGFAALARLRDAGLLAGSLGTVRTPSGGLHVYFAGTEQGNGAMPRHGIDFRGRGGYVLAPPSAVDGKPYDLIGFRDSAGTVEFAAIRRFLEPPKLLPAGRPSDRPGDHGALVRWVAEQGEGNRNHGLYWAARRAVESGAEAAVFAALVGAAVQAGLPSIEAERTVRSARHNPEAAR